MQPKTYEVIWGPWRFYLPIGIKTLIAFLIVIATLAGSIYYYTSVTLSAQLEKEALDHLQSTLKGGWRIYYSRMDQMKYSMLQAATENHIKSAVVKKDSHFLQNLLNGFALNMPYVDLWAVVDEKQRVIGRKNGRTGDLLETGGVVAKSLKTGDVVTSTEKVEKEILNLENADLSKRVERTGLMQVVSVPVVYDRNIRGAFVTGILLDGYNYLPNSIYEHLSTESAVFGSIFHESRIIAATSLPTSIFSPMFRIPESINSEITAGRGFYGKALLEGIETYISAEPVLNAGGKIVGGIAVAVRGSDVKHVINTINSRIFLYTGFGVIFSLMLAALAYRDIITPTKALTNAMTDIAAGNLNVRTRIKTKDEFEKIGQGFNNMIETLWIREQRLDRFNELSKLLITSLDPEILLNKALSRMLELTASHMGIVYLHEEDTGVLKPVAFYGVGEEELKTIKIGEGLPGICASEKKAITLQDIPEETLLLETGFIKVRPKGVAWFAMCYKDKLLGVFAIGSILPYNEDELKHMEYLVAQIAIALDNATIHKEVEHLSITDSLTGLYNRRHFFKRFASEFQAAKRYNYPFALVMMDIDNFKNINDTLGHQQGDIILKEIGRILSDNTREADIWARYGGEEFIGYLPHCGKNEGYKMAEKIRKIIEEHEFTGMEGRKVMVSMGVAYFPGLKADTEDEIVGFADRCLYQAKSGGKNKVVVA